MTDIHEQILYEDSELIVCRKDPGVPVQSARIGTLSMESMLRTYLREETPGQVPYLGIVHRLDQPVTGILVFAKTPEGAAGLNRQIAQGQMEKLYLALVHSEYPITGKKTLTDYLIRDGKTNTSVIVPKGTPGAKAARLDYEPFFFHAEDPDRLQTRSRALLLIHLHTGRHHQIRAQLAGAGIPILGDRKYGQAEPVPDFPFPALAAWSLTFRHPKTGRQMRFRLAPEQIWFIS